LNTLNAPEFATETINKQPQKNGQQMSGKYFTTHSTCNGHFGDKTFQELTACILTTNKW